MINVFFSKTIKLLNLIVNMHLPFYIANFRCDTAKIMWWYTPLSQPVSLSLMHGGTFSFRF